MITPHVKHLEEWYYWACASTTAHRLCATALSENLPSTQLQVKANSLLKFDVISTPKQTYPLTMFLANTAWRSCPIVQTLELRFYFVPSWQKMYQFSQSRSPHHRHITLLWLCLAMRAILTLSISMLYLRHLNTHQ